MIRYLKIKNLALLDSAALEFEPGFNVITGETGAGKSVLLGALGILAGNRVPKTIIRAGTPQCEVEAALSLAPAVAAKINEFLEANGLPACDDGQLVLKRTVCAAKAGRIFINGGLATLAQLALLGNEWIDFHGPGEPQKLFRENCQLQLLDLAAGNSEILKEYHSRRQKWLTARAEIESLRSQEKLSDDELAFAQSCLDALNTLNLSDDAIARLERSFAQISHARELEQLLGAIENTLGDDGLAGTLPQTVRLASDIAKIIPDAKTLADRADSLAIEIDDLRAEFARLHEKMQTDEEAEEEITERMNRWQELKRKYGPAPEQVRAKRDALAERIARQSDIDDAIRHAQERVDASEIELIMTAGKLYKSRLNVAGTLMKTAMENLKQLGFKKAALRAELTRTAPLGENGDTHCRFLFSANAGQKPLPLDQIASAGETARVMLALKAVLAKADETPVLVFDEVDANVGGEIAVHVARKLAEIARERQVFCITHLAQVAACGNHHFCVEKIQNETETTVRVLPLGGGNNSEREDELARMLGDRNSKSARAHAKDLLQNNVPAK